MACSLVTPSLTAENWDAKAGIKLGKPGTSAPAATLPAQALEYGMAVDVSISDEAREAWALAQSEGKPVDTASAVPAPVVESGGAPDVSDTPVKNTLPLEAENTKQGGVTTEAETFAPEAQAVANATLNSGAKVSLFKKSDADAYLAEIIRTDGSIQRIEITKNTIITEDEGGSLRILESQNQHEEMVGTGGNDVFIALHAANIVAGDGDDTILCAISSRSIDAGQGNNTIIANWVDQVKTGDGNTNIQARHIGQLQLGDGNNSVTAEYVESLTTGKGDNTVDVQTLQNAALGDGNNSIKADELIQLTAGNGNNIFSVGYTDLMSAGDGNNVINISRNSGTVRVGNGKNTVSSAQDLHTLSVGNGNNAITISGLAAKLSIGHGDNTVAVSRLGDDYWVSASLNAGNGNNNISVDHIGYEGSIKIGDGKNSLSVKNDSYKAGIIVGNGNNNISVENINNKSKIEAGNGENVFNIETFGVASISAGSGNNGFYIGTSSGGTLSTGDGNNTVSIDNAFIFRGVSGAGDDTFTFGDVTSLNLKTGAGNDVLTVNGRVGSSEERRRNIPKGAIDAFIDMGSGDNTAVFKGDVAGMDFTSTGRNDSVTVYGTLSDSILSTGREGGSLRLHGLIIDSSVNDFFWDYRDSPLIIG